MKLYVKKWSLGIKPSGRNKDGRNYKIIPIADNDKKGKSPLEDIPYITADITTKEIVELIRESRAGV